MSPGAPSEQSLRNGLAARNGGDPGRAEYWLRRAAEEAPKEPEPHHHLGVLLEAAGRVAEAEDAYRQALRLAPAAAGTQRLLGRLLLSRGRYQEGFALFEARHALPEMAKPALPFPEWRGEDLAGKRLLIWPEQGFGDQIQFARFAPLLQARGAEVTLLCRPPLARLFDGCFRDAGVRVLAAAGGVEFPDPDYWVMTMSLAWRMGLEAEALPNAPYLHALEPAPHLEGSRVGLVTQGNPSNANDANRSLSPDDAKRLRALAPAAIDLEPSATGARDFADTAAILSGLDLVICVDTAVAHLAGAMGVPCWVLVPAVGTDWRWGRTSDRTSWYPSVRLLRQERAGDWSLVLAQVGARLERGGFRI